MEISKTRPYTHPKNVKFGVDTIENGSPKGPRSATSKKPPLVSDSKPRTSSGMREIVSGMGCPQRNSTNSCVDVCSNSVPTFHKL